MIGGLDEGLRVHCLAMRPGKYDRKHEFLIQGAELRELKELDLPESFGLDRRIERYQGKRPLGVVSLGFGRPVGCIVVRVGSAR